jgi:hypothetical protein
VKLAFVFPTQQIASDFVRAMGNFQLDGVSAHLNGPVVEIHGANHPILAVDLAHAAELVGGLPIPNRKDFQ